MKAPREPMFLARGTYRRRRAIEAARLLPFAGVFLVLLPALWGGEAAVGTAWGGVYIFAVWFLLIAVAAVLSRLLDRAGDEDEDGED